MALESVGNKSLILLNVLVYFSVLHVWGLHRPPLECEVVAVTALPVLVLMVLLRLTLKWEGGAVSSLSSAVPVLPVTTLLLSPHPLTSFKLHPGSC